MPTTLVKAGLQSTQIEGIDFIDALTLLAKF
jgi:hypothetical protein